MNKKSKALQKHIDTIEVSMSSDKLGLHYFILPHATMCTAFPHLYAPSPPYVPSLPFILLILFSPSPLIPTMVA